MASPVLADLAEQAVIDGISLGRAWRVMAHRDGEAQEIADLILQGLFPGATTRAVASAPIRQDENLASLRIAQSSLVQPPLSDSIDSEVRRVVADADEKRSGLACRS